MSAVQSAHLETRAHRDGCNVGPCLLAGISPPDSPFCTAFAKGDLLDASILLYLKGEFRSWKNADGSCAVFRDRESSCARIEVVNDKFLADVSRTRFNRVQAVIAHIDISSFDSCKLAWRGDEKINILHDAEPSLRAPLSVAFGRGSGG